MHQDAPSRLQSACTGFRNPSFEEWEAQGADSDEPDPDKFTDPWDESYNAMDDYWYY
jgi:hypothetical protein